MGNCEATIGNRQCCSEVFAACAEVQLVGESVPTPSTTSTTTAAPTPTTTAPGTTTPIVTPTSAPPAPTPQATPAPPVLDGTCVQNPDCSTNAWCADGTYVNWCPAHGASQCPTPQCMVQGTSTPATTPEPEPETEPVTTTPATTPEAEPEPEPEPETHGVTCMATPGLNRGVSDSACAQCEM